MEDWLNSIKTFMDQIELSQIIDLIVALVVLIIFIIFSAPVSSGIINLFTKNDNKKKKIKNTKIYKRLRAIINLLGLYISLNIFDLSDIQQKFINQCYRIIAIWAVAFIIDGIFDLQKYITRKYTKGPTTKKDEFSVRVIEKIISFLLYLTATYLTLKEFGFDLGGFAAGIGIGSAIVALAAQNLIKQLLAGFAIISDKTFEIGDWIEVGDVSGTVESITWRSTKIRTIEDTVVIFDNSVLITSNIVNWGKITKRIFKENFSLALETSEATVEKVIKKIKFILKYNKDINPDSIVVRFSEIKTDCLNIAIFFETTITDYNEYVDFCSKINLTILNILETQGVSLAYPGRNIYIKEEPGDRVNLDHVIEEKNVTKKATTKKSPAVKNNSKHQ